MTNDHDIMCPSFANCNPCNLRREEINRGKVLEYFQVFENDLADKHFYLLSVTLKPNRTNYHRFSLDSIKKVGRELINGMNTLSGISNRKFWSMYVLGGIRYFSIKQETENDFPCFCQSLIFWGDKDNLDVKMNAQIKYRLAKISRDLEFNIKYLGDNHQNELVDAIDVTLSIFHDSFPIKKLGEGFKDAIIKFRDQRPIVFGGKLLHTNIEEV